MEDIRKNPEAGEGFRAFTIGNLRSRRVDVGLYSSWLIGLSWNPIDCSSGWAEVFFGSAIVKKGEGGSPIPDRNLDPYDLGDGWEVQTFMS